MDGITTKAGIMTKVGIMINNIYHGEEKEFKL